MRHLALELRRLQALDWRALDVREASRWPFTLRVVCLALLGMACFGAAHRYLVMPKVDRLERAEARESELVRQYEQKASQAASLPELRTQLNELEERNEALLGQLPGSAEVSSLIDVINAAALDSRLNIDFIRLRDSIPGDFYIEQPFDIQVQGGYHQIANFLSEIAGLPHIVTLHDFILEPVDARGPLALSVLAKTYHYRTIEPK